MQEHACNQGGNLTVTLSDGTELTHLEIMPTVSDLYTCMGMDVTSCGKHATAASCQGAPLCSWDDSDRISSDMKCKPNKISGPLGPYPSSTVCDKSISALTVNCGGTGPETLSLDMWSKDMGVVTLQNLEQLTYNDMMTCIGHHNSNSTPAYIDADGQCATMAPTTVISNRMTLFNDMSDCQQGRAGQCDCCSTTITADSTAALLPRNQLSSIDIAGTLHYCANNTHPKSKTILTPHVV